MRFLAGHTKEVRDAAYLPDGRLVSISGDKTARLWDPLAGTGTVIHKAKGPLYALAVSPDGRTVAVSGRHPEPGTPVALYEVEHATVARTLTWAAEDIVFRVDATGHSTGDFAPVARAIWSLSFSADGRFLAAAGRKPGAANIPNGAGGLSWTLPAANNFAPLPGLDVYAVRYAPEATLLAVTARRQVRFYDRGQPASELGQRIVEFIHHGGFFSDGHIDSAGDSAIFTYPVQCDWAPAVTFLPADGRAAIAAGSYVHLVDPTGNRKPVKVKCESRVVTALAPTPDGKSLLVGGKPGRVEVFDLSSAKPARRTAFDFDVGGVYGLAVSPDGLTFAVAAEKGLLVCDVETG